MLVKLGGTISSFYNGVYFIFYIFVCFIPVYILYLQESNFFYRRLFENIFVIDYFSLVLTMAIVICTVIVLKNSDYLTYFMIFSRSVK